MSEKTKVEFLYLSEEDMIEAGVLDAGKCVDVMGEVVSLLSKGDYLMGGKDRNAHGIMLNFPLESDIEDFPLNDSRDRRFMAMPAYLGGRFHLAGQKWYGSNGRNVQKGLPRSILMVTLNDVETGQPLAYMSANLLSAMRTGAMPGLAAKYLTASKTPECKSGINYWSWCYGKDLSGCICQCLPTGGYRKDQRQHTDIQDSSEHEGIYRKRVSIH